MQPALRIEPEFYRFVNEEVLPLASLDPDRFWRGLEGILADLVPVNQYLLEVRERLQSRIDEWHLRRNPEEQLNQEEYQAFLRDIGYLLDEGEDFTISTTGVDEEIANLAGPQLVVPISNARFALNAVNARWGSLYDALYGSDVIPSSGEFRPGHHHNPARASEVVRYVKSFLDKVFPLSGGSHEEVERYFIDGQLLCAALPDGECVELKDQEQFVAFQPAAVESEKEPQAIVLKNNGLHLIIELNRNGAIGKNDPAGIHDVQAEAALTVIMDCEDSVAAVDAQDKTVVYKNWLGLIQGTLECQLEKNGKIITRKMNRDRFFRAKKGGAYRLAGRALMLNRNVGHLMTSNLIRNENGEEMPEGILDAVFTSLIASLDLQDGPNLGNSRQGSIYIVKPKMHGPEEVAFTCALFSRVEELLSLKPNTLKLGIMDEERRTTVNLKECIRAARERVVFINTGFLDRTGDEIHTSMHAGPFLPKAQLKTQPWIKAYENWNVDIGLSCGLPGKAQIGKGMWAMPDEMAKMMEEKIAHPLAGATTAWVPSPTAAVLHALHYHYVNVFDVHKKLRNRSRAKLEDILTIPLMRADCLLSPAEIEKELKNNIQGILGYVVRWVEQGVGCSKVPDISDIGLMEDRATLRISSQHIANWLLHGVCSREFVMTIMSQMAAVVDRQNDAVPGYVRMTPNTGSSLAFQAAERLIFHGLEQTNGYTEPILHHFRQLTKKFS